jgi:hypothetical protein
MNNTTDIGGYGWLVDYTTRDIELVNMVQSGVSLLATICIFVKVFDFGRFFKSIRATRDKHRKEKERKELERVRKLINSVKDNMEVHIDDLLSDDEETVIDDRGVMKIAHKKEKKKHHTENKV